MQDDGTCLGRIDREVRRVRPPLSNKLFPVCRVGKMMASREVGIIFFHFHFCLEA